MKYMKISEWKIPDSQISLLKNEVHIWRTSLDDHSEDTLKYLYSILSKDEKSKVERLQFKYNRHNYIVARGFLRIILGRYLDIESNDIYFSYNRYGKPKLEGMSIGDYLHFNLSHSGRMVLYAISLDSKVGIDIEFVRPYKKAEAIVERYFSDQEKEEFRALPMCLKEQSFFLGWSRKEAYIKAHGMGMQIPFDEFSVTMVPGEPVKLVHNQDNIDNGAAWSLRDIIPIANYATAVAVEGQDSQFRFWDCAL